MIQGRAALKTHFQTGDRPTQTQFENFLDSYVHMTEVNHGTVTISGTISATTGSFAYLDITGTTAFNSITVGGGFGNTGLTIDTDGKLETNSSITSDTFIKAGTSFIIGSANINEAEITVLDNVTPGVAQAGKVLVLDGDKNIATINSLTAISGSFSMLSGSSGYIKNVDIDNSAIGFGGASSASFTTIQAVGNISSSGGTLFAKHGYFANNVAFGTPAGVIISGSSGNITASGNISASGTGSFGAIDVLDFGDISASGDLIIHNITASGEISASGMLYANGADFGDANIDNVGSISLDQVLPDTGSSLQIGADDQSTMVNISGHLFAQASVTASGNISASGGNNIIGNDVIIGEDCDSSLQIKANVTASCNISASGTGSFGYIMGDGSGLTNISSDEHHGNQPTITGSITVNYNSNQTLVTNNTGEFTIPIDSNYTVQQGAQIDLQYTPLAERLFRYDVDTGTFIPYAQANIDSETTMMKGFGAGTAGVGNDVTIRHNATVPENFVSILHTTTNVTQSEDPNNNPITTDPHSITIQDQSTYTIKAGADVTVDGVHHGVVRKDIALLGHIGIGDTQAIGPSGSDSFNDQYNNLYPSASTHLHISASSPIVKIEDSTNTCSGLLTIEGNIEALCGTGSFGHLVASGISANLIINGNQTSTTESVEIPHNFNNTIVTNNTGDFTVNADYTVRAGAQVDLQYTPIAERLYRYDVDTGDYIPYAQANIDSETTLIKGFGAGTAGVGNDSTVRHNATVPENFTAILHTTTNVTQSEDPNNNPMTTDPHSITIQNNSTYTIKSGADVTVDGVHHGVVRKDIALFQTLGIGDTQAIGPSGSNHFNDQYNNIYPSASAHLHISASNPLIKVEASSGTGLLDIDGNISASGGTVTALSGSFSELSGMSPLTVNGETIFTGPITASGDVSSSGNINVNQINSRGERVAYYDGQQMLLGSNSINTSIVGASIFLGPVLGAITASGEISSSSDITGVTGSFEGGLVLTSPNGTKYRFTTNDSGHLSLTGSAV